MCPKGIRHCRNAQTQLSGISGQTYFQSLPQASGAIYNKFDKIINTPPIAAIFSSVVSTISIRDIIEDGKIVVVDLGSAATVDIIKFVGTLLINMFNLENKIRFDLGDARKVPFNIYIDEVHMFSAPVIRELLNNVRKYNMKVTVATQSIKVLDDSLAKELDDLFRCMVMFRCDAETGRLLARNLPLNEQQLAQLSFHRFAAFSQGFQRVSGIGKTKHVEIPSRWRQVAQDSLERYGKAIPSLSEGSLGSENADRTIPKLSPLGVLCTEHAVSARRQGKAQGYSLIIDCKVWGA